MAERMWEDQQSGYPEPNCMPACKTFLIEEMLHWVRELYRRIAVQNQLNCRGSRLHSRTTHHEGVVSLTPRTLFSTVTNREGGYPFLYLVVRKA